MKHSIQTESGLLKYAHFRVCYPAGLVQLLQNDVCGHKLWTVADIGSGTGNSAEPFLKAGYTVHGVEPRTQLRAVASVLIGSEYSGFHSWEGAAEDTRLPSQSIDLVVCAQSFHRFDQVAAKSEFQRILRPPCRVALIWNVRRRAGSAFLESYDTLLERFFGHDNGWELYQSATSNAKLSNFFGSTGYLNACLPNNQRVNHDGFLSLLDATNYSPEHGDCTPCYQRSDEATQLFRKYETDGYVDIEHDLVVFSGMLK